MPFVQISDPNILDLQAWQQVINTVNQHSDSISALTNNFGLYFQKTYDSTDTSNKTWQSPFDLGSCVIQFGMSRLYDAVATSSTNNINYYNTVQFNHEFKVPPVVTATLYQPGSSTAEERNDDAIISLWGITSSQFSYRFNRPTLTIDTEAVINWIAIGPK
jgi:hypothetical protein